MRRSMRPAAAPGARPRLRTRASRRCSYCLTTRQANSFGARHMEARAAKRTGLLPRCCPSSRPLTSVFIASTLARLKRRVCTPRVAKLARRLIAVLTMSRRPEKSRRSPSLLHSGRVTSRWPTHALAPPGTRTSRFLELTDDPAVIHLPLRSRIFTIPLIPCGSARLGFLSVHKFKKFCAVSPNRAFVWKRNIGNAGLDGS
jgi:hypothetical protein